MKRELIISLIIISLLLIIAMPISNDREQVLATYNHARIIVNGIQISTKDAEPVTINGIIYLPIRTLPEALQMQVDWNADANTIFINSDAAQTKPDN